MVKLRSFFLNKFRTSILLALVTVSLAGITGCGSSGTGQLFLVSLGDSLSVGVQPDATGMNQTTDKGYADVLHQLLLPAFPNLQLIKLGCPGETTVTMADGGICSYPAGSQLDAAKQFILAHQNEILLVTVDIGVNDLLTSGCIDQGPPLNVDQACVQNFLQNVLPPHLTFVMNELFQTVSGAHIPIIGMNYYNPFVVIYFQVYPIVAQAIADQALAQITAGCAQFCTAQCAPSMNPPACEAVCNPQCIQQQVGTGVIQQAILDNAPQATVDQITGVDDLAMAFDFQVLKGVYDLVKFPVADIYTAFKSGDFTLVPAPAQFLPIETAPVNALTACQLTFMCAPDPVGPNIHATDAGYQLIGQTFFDLFNSL
jgi:GDSL-like lipase/acylhydrolase family protein